MIRSLTLVSIAMLALAAPAVAQDRTVAVTFDDLPYQTSSPAELCDPQRVTAMTDAFVGMLRPLNMPGAVFVNEGAVCEAERATIVPAMLEAWHAAGFEIGNHTATHINLHRNTVEAYLADVDAGAAIAGPWLRARGERLRYFRHPYLFTGETPEKHSAVAEGLKARGYEVAPVTLDNSDWLFGGAYRRAEARGDAELMRRIGEAYVAHMAAALDHWEPYSAELTGGREPAQVLLLHANSLNRDWFGRVHALYQARGYRFVTLEEALRDPIYGHADTYVRPNGPSWLHRWTATEGRRIRWEVDPPEWVQEIASAKD